MFWRKELKKLVVCKKCESNNYEIKQSKTKTGAFCKDCGAWIKWVKSEEINNYYKTELSKPENKDKVKRSILNRNGITRILCDRCKCQLYNSNAPEPIGQFNLLNAKFCPQCGAELL